MTSSGTTLEWARANWRKWWATVCSWAAQSGSAVSTESWARTISATPSSTAALLGDVAVEHHRISAQGVAEAADGQSVHTPVAVDDPQTDSYFVMSAVSQYAMTSSETKF